MQTRHPIPVRPAGAEYPGPDQDVLSCERPFKCCQSPSCCCLQEITVTRLTNDHDQAVGGPRVLGKLQEVWTCLGSQVRKGTAFFRALLS
eukprot:SAG22_NODE_1233_length_5065_cov_12.050141_3_plen_90_part_00